MSDSDAPRRLEPGEYWFEDLVIGDHYDTGHIVVTEAHITGFAGLSGDFFDLHVDDEFARSHGFPARVAHGLLGLAMADGLKNRAPVRIVVTAALGWNWRFTAPIFAGDRIGVAVAVNAKRLNRSNDRGILTLGFTVRNQRGETVQEGETTLITPLKSPSAAP